MSFMKTFFGKGKKKDEKEESKKESNQFRRDQTRRSIHGGDRSFGAEHLPSFYQSVGKKYPKGPKSCPGGPGEMREGDDESMGVRADFDLKRRNKGILLNRRDERNSDYSSQDPSPMSSHFSRREREREPSRHYHSSLDESDEENMDYMDRIRDKLRRTAEEKMSYQDKYNNMKRALRIERSERESEKMRNNEIIDVLRSTNRELKTLNASLKGELDKWRRMDKERYESSFDTHNNSDIKLSVQEYNSMRNQLVEFSHMKSQYESQHPSRQPYMAPPMAPFGQFPPLPFPNSYNFRAVSTPTGTPATSIVTESAHDGAGESLVDPADNSYRPFNATASEVMPSLFSEAFPFTIPPSTETPRSADRSSSTISLHEQSELLGDSSFRPPIPSSMPPRRTQSNPTLSPTRKSSHSL